MLTFVGCLVLPLQMGIIIGVGINMISILHSAARPKLTVETLNVSPVQVPTEHQYQSITSSLFQSPAGNEYLMITPDRCLVFPSVDYVRNIVTKHSMRVKVPVVIDCSHIYGADYTAATVIDSITQDFAKRDQPLLYFNLKPGVCAVFEGLSPREFTVYYREDMLDVLLKERVSSKPPSEVVCT